MWCTCFSYHYRYCISLTVRRSAPMLFCFCGIDFPCVLLCVRASNCFNYTNFQAHEYTIDDNSDRRLYVGNLDQRITEWVFNDLQLICIILMCLVHGSWRIKDSSNLFCFNNLLSVNVCPKGKVWLGILLWPLFIYWFGLFELYTCFVICYRLGLWDFSAFNSRIWWVDEEYIPSTICCSTIRLSRF